jgi:hypothetical protein
MHNPVHLYWDSVNFQSRNAGVGNVIRLMCRWVPQWLPAGRWPQFAAQMQALGPFLFLRFEAPRGRKAEPCSANCARYPLQYVNDLVDSAVQRAKRPQSLILPALRTSNSIKIKNAVFWHFKSRDSCKNRRFRGTYRIRRQVIRIGELGTTLAVTSNRSKQGKNVFAACCNC